MKSAFFLLVSILFSFLLAACQPIVVPATPGEPRARVPIRVEVLPFLSFAPLFIAQDEGYFAAQGLDVQFVRLTDGTAPIAALLQGDIDVISPQIESGLLNAMARGADVKIVADKGYLASGHCPAYALLARKALVDDGKLTGPAALKGLTLAIEPLTSEGFYITKLLGQANLTLADIGTVDIAPPALADALNNGSVDLVHIGEPWITRLVSSGAAIVWLPVQDVVPDFQWAVLAFGPTLLKGNRETGEKFIQAYLQGVRQYNQGKTARNLEIVAANTGLEVSLLEKACWPAVHDDGDINIQSVLDFQSWALQVGLLDTQVTEEQFWDGSFVAQANAALDQGQSH